MNNSYIGLATLKRGLKSIVPKGVKISDSCLAKVSVELLPLERMMCVLCFGDFVSNDCSDSSVLFIFFETKLV